MKWLYNIHTIHLALLMVLAWISSLITINECRNSQYISARFFHSSSVSRQAERRNENFYAKNQSITSTWDNQMLSQTTEWKTYHFCFHTSICSSKNSQFKTESWIVATHISILIPLLQMLVTTKFSIQQQCYFVLGIRLLVVCRLTYNQKPSRSDWSACSKYTVTLDTWKYERSLCESAKHISCIYFAFEWFWCVFTFCHYALDSAKWKGFPSHSFTHILFIWSDMVQANGDGYCLNNR